MKLIFSESIYKEKLWGLETWLVSAHPGGDIIIKTGEFKGITGAAMIGEGI